MVISWVASLIARLLYDDPKVVKRGTGETVIEKVARHMWDWSQHAEQSLGCLSLPDQGLNFQHSLIIARRMQVPPSIRAQLGLLFNTWVGFLLTYLPWLRHYQLYTSQALGRRYDSVASAADIPGFVEVRSVNHRWALYGTSYDILDSV